MPEPRHGGQGPGALSDTDLAAASAVAALAAPGDRLVKIDVGFYTSVATDLTLMQVTAQDFRDTVEEITWVDCGMCAAGPVGISGTATPALLLVPLLALLGACVALLRRRRSR